MITHDSNKSNIDSKGMIKKIRIDLRECNKWKESLQIPKGISYPVTTNDIPLYEELNDTQINVFSLDNYTEEVQDIRRCIVSEYKSNKHRKRVINLLLIRENEKSHYVFITNLSRLFTSKTTHTTKFHCPHCIVKCFTNMELLNKHIEKCVEFDEEERIKIDVICECPVEGKNIMEFKNHGNKFHHPYHVIADFESSLVNIDHDDKATTYQTQMHNQNSFGIKYNCIHHEHSKPIKIFNNANKNDVNKEFIETLEAYAIESYNLTQQNKDRKILYMLMMKKNNILKKLIVMNAK